MNFILLEMTYLRYFLPIIIEGNKRGITSILNVSSPMSHKYNSPNKFKDLLNNLSKLYNFKIEHIPGNGNIDLKYFKPPHNLVFFCEGMGSYNRWEQGGITRSFPMPVINRRHPEQKHISITYMSDYQFLYPRYIDHIDHVVMPSRRFAEEFSHSVTDKNVYCGSPKYDIPLTKEVRENKRAIVMHPDSYAASNNIHRVHQKLRDRGFEIIVKTKAKDPVPNELRGDLFIEDGDWFPHPSLPLIYNSDLVINFDSTTIKEAVMMETPILNFNALHNDRVYKWLYEYDFCFDLPHNDNSKKIGEGIDYLINNDFTELFSEVKKKYFWDNNASKKILDTFIGEYNE